MYCVDRRFRKTSLDDSGRFDWSDPEHSNTMYIAMSTSMTLDSQQKAKNQAFEETCRVVAAKMAGKILAPVLMDNPQELKVSLASLGVRMAGSM